MIHQTYAKKKKKKKKTVSSGVFLWFHSSFTRGHIISICLSGCESHFTGGYSSQRVLSLKIIPSPLLPPPIIPLPQPTPRRKDGWLVVLGLTALSDSISVYIGPSSREREQEKRNDRGEKKYPNNPHPHLLQAQ